MLKWATILCIWGFISLSLCCVWYGYDLPDISDMHLMGRRASVTMLDKNGTILATYGDVYGQSIRAQDLPPHVIQAFLAIEDRRFYNHFGIDVLGLLRAAWANYKAKRVVQGGSTITQQLAKNFLQSKKLYSPTDRSFRRKFQEIIMAAWLEYRFNKSQILTMYLNRVYFGGGTFGIDGAARCYYGRSAKNLTLYEAAVLAGLLKAPSQYSPLNNPRLSDRRARQVLKSMAESGFISPSGVKAALALASPPPEMKGGSSVRYFTDWVFDSLPQCINSIEQDLEVVTTLDVDLQALADTQASVALATQRWKAEQVALVSMAPQGAIRAMVGGVSYHCSQFNRATQALRQPGSAFKFFVFLSALEKGLTPDTLIDDTPVTLGTWSPKNYFYKSQGQVSIQHAFALSANSVAVRLGTYVGLAHLVEIMQRLGLKNPVSSNMTITLGSGEVTLLELTSAFAVIENNGLQVIPHGVLEIRDRQGYVLYQQKPSYKRLLSPTVAQQMKQLLRAVITEGTGRRLSGLSKPVWGKTGTSQAYRDLWFIGGTNQIVTGTWMGIDSDKPMVRTLGGNPSLILWRSFMEKVLKTE